MHTGVLPISKELRSDQRKMFMHPLDKATINVKRNYKPKEFELGTSFCENAYEIY
jgi:hypothetical protein